MLSDKEKQRIKNISLELFETSYRYSERSSYGIKVVFERITGLYFSNDEMKSLMSEMGYVPDDRTALNPRYKIKFKRL